MLQTAIITVVMSFAFVSCKTTDSTSDVKRDSEESRAYPELWYFYFVENLPPNIAAMPGNNGQPFGVEVIYTSWSQWGDIKDVRARMVPDRDSFNENWANVKVKENASGNEQKIILVHFRSADTGRQSARADIYDPHDERAKGGTILEVVLSNKKQWTEDEFSSAVSHQIGHILGLRNAREPGHIMSDPIPPNLGGVPTAGDREQAKKELYWLDDAIDPETRTQNEGRFDALRPD